MKKLLRNRLLLLLMLLRFCVYAQAQDSNDQRITLLAGNASLSSVLKNIEHQTNKRFNYSENEVNINEKVNVNYNEAPLNQVLGQLFSAKGISWRMIDDGIYLRKEARKESSPSKDSLNVYLLRGRVTDEEGQPLVGATILVKGTSAGAVADAEGRFTLAGIPHNAVIRVSFTSYEASEMVPGGRRSLDVVLKKKIGSLDETVVIGYGTTTKRFNTGAVSTVKADVIESQPVTDPLLALQGRVPGLYIAQNSGIPGAASVVRLRGQNSISNGNDPFYIVDGVPYSPTSSTSTFIGGGAVGSPTSQGSGLSPFNFLNPSDIERIDVLKDADATAIYGSRGANGVILITTKKGKPGKTRLDVNASYGGGKVANKLSLLNTPQYLKMRKEGFINDGKKPSARDYDVNGTWDSTSYTDWQKSLIGGTATFTNVQAGISGGSGNTQFALRGGYSNQSTVFPGNYNDRKASVLFNVTHRSTNERFHADITASYLNDKSILPQIDFTSLITLAPDAPPIYDSLGNLNWAKTFVNPLGNTKKKAQAISENLIGNVELSYLLLPGLTAKSSFGYNRLQTDQTIQTPITAFPPTTIDNSAKRENYYGGTNSSGWLIEPQLNYIKKIAAGTLTVLLGATFQQNNSNSMGTYANDFTSDAAITNIAAAKNIRIMGVDYATYKYNAIFGRINYEWKEKYVLNLTTRRDGSSRFGPGKQFGNFGAIGAAWIFSDENWIKGNLPFLSFGKIRASYGTTGNDQIGNYQYLSTYSNTYDSYQGLIGLAPTRIPNSDFGWEQVRKIEVGLETGFLKDQILFNIDFYRNRSSNQLVGYSLPTTTGFSSVQYNLPALVQNTGMEADLHVEAIHTRSLNWRIGANISVPRNKLLKYPALEASSDNFSYVIGQSILGRKLLEYTGVDPQTGVYTVRDVNNDNNIDRSDYIKYKTITQQYFGGIQNSFSYKGFQLDIFIQYVKQNAYDYSSNIASGPGVNNKNFPTDIVDKVWRSKGDHAEYQKISSGTNETAQASSYRSESDAIVVDASFIRLKNVMLSYAIPQKILNKISIQDIRFYVQGQNLMTFTSYVGLDPESQGGLTLPPLRMITGGIKLSL
ncbi:SusC/RagA family TonB-linked outer membrane protein [Chitinophaga arvensicola]|uniref:TonB-linked outer membrane protein, SusC/RagA family n=1 Tax=Chitinophaga arvensicola TaxID=29529 RepID=A0A1I0RPK9_9BACT|nr:SusC/RagA family TonB-linked outer membrane protein [Chitinophaga arvensicola]SEW43114.1 TonB-linked outer membrane protein, SusC/RagA family [Chitinophaga arvensicola]